MLYNVLSKLIAKTGLTSELQKRIDVLYALGKLTEEEYRNLIG